MSNSASKESAGVVDSGSSGESLESDLPAPEASENGGPPGLPQVTFRGNTYDLISLGSLITGVALLLSCLTCNMGYYCLPLIAVALGAVGVLSARRSVEAERTKLWSWLGIAAGGIVLLLIALCIVLYIGFIVLAAVSGEWD
jgi:hypothetical protein